MGMTGIVHLPPVGSNYNFHGIKPMLQLIQMKGLFGGLAHEDPREHLQTFVHVSDLFTFSSITKQAIRL